MLLTHRKSSLISSTNSRNSAHEFSVCDKDVHGLDFRFFGSGLLLPLTQGWAIDMFWGHFEKVAFSGGPHLPMEIEASPW